MMEYFQLEKEDGIARVLINRAEQRNAFNEMMWFRLAEIMETLSDDKNTQVVIITGKGSSFASGADISRLKDLIDQQTHLQYLATVDRAINSIFNCRQPVIAMINGWALGAGCELAIACDLRICCREAKFSIPAAKLGIALHYSLIQRIVDLVGVAAAKELLLIGEPVNSRWAYSAGLVNRVVSREKLEQETEKIARTIAGNAPLAVRGMKEAVNRLAEQGKSAENEALAQIERASFESEDFFEGASAFMEKRKPIWKGR